MHNWKQLVRERLHGVNLEGAHEAQVVEELAQYIEDAYDECRARGASADEALQRALAELADTSRLVQQLRKQEPAWQDPPPVLSRNRGGMSVFTLLYDFKMAFRSLRNRPGFSLMVVGMLALGIAANAAIFSILDGFFLRPLPFRDPGLLVDLDEIAPKWNLQFVAISNADSFGWRAATAFEGMAFYRTSDVTLTGGESAQRVRAAQVTHDLLALLGLRPLLGRGFSPDDDKPGAAPVAMISHGFWRRVYGGDPNVLGHTIQLSNSPFTVIGVLPQEAVIPDRADVWRPLQLNPNRNNGWYLRGIGRLSRGVSIEEARADLLRVHKLIPDSNANHAAATSPRVDPFGERFLGDYRPVANVLISAVTVVLLIACVNVAALMMVRGAARAREMAIRTAIGASRVRIVQHLIAENVVLAAAGGLAGVLMGRLALRGLIALMPEGLPAFIVFDFDFRFALFDVAVTSAAALLSGLVPALQAAGADSAGNLPETTARTTFSRGRRRTLNALVAGEVALALMLLVGAGLLVRAFQKVMRIDPGFRAENVLTYNVVLPGNKYPKADQRLAFYQNLLDQTRALPGVKFAAAATAPPLGGHWGDFYVGENARPLGKDEKTPVVLKVFVTPGYFDAIGMTLLAGRTLDDRDGENADAPPLLVNESFVRQNWPWATSQQVLGKGVRGGGMKDWMRVVGVVKDDRHYGLEQPPRPTVFFPYRAGAGDITGLSIVIRTLAAPELLVSPSRDLLRQADRDLPMFEVHTMTERVNQSLWARRGYSWLVGVFAVVALVLAAAGIYGVVSYAVNQRTREIGIRMALGARPDQVMTGILASGMMLVMGGAAAGLAVMWMAVGVMRELLFGIDGKDPIIYGAVVAGVAAVGFCANWFPARRAATVDPIRALHTE